MDRIILDMENVRTCSSLLHDSMCEEWTYEYSSKRLTMHIRYDEEKSAFKNVVFECVAAHNMVSCDYWGPSPYIFGIELIASESSFLYKQLTDEIKNMCYTNPFDNERKECIEARVQFTSGDVLSVLCQRVVIEG